jgi:tRNA nucleotidyltransferase (CCA-adding enzyme)
VGAWRERFPDPKDRAAVRRWLAGTGEHADDLLAIITGLPTARWASVVSRLPAVVEQIRKAGDPLALKDLAVKGDDLIGAGVRAGPDVGEALARLLDEVLEDPARNTREYLLSRV